MSVLETRWHGQIWVYPLEGEKILVGSDHGAHISLRQSSVSPFHCQLRKKAVTYVLSNLSDSARTFLNGRSIREQALCDRDLIQVGRIRLVYGDSATLEGLRIFCPVSKGTTHAEDLPIATVVESAEIMVSRSRSAPGSSLTVPSFAQARPREIRPKGGVTHACRVDVRNGPD